MSLFWAEMPYKTYRLSGADARDFLQGQVTQDVKKITTGHCHYAAYCNHKGRMFANFLLSTANDEILLRMHQSVADNVIKRLSMFILRADARLEETEYLSIGLSADAAVALCQHLGLTLPEVFQTAHSEDLTLCALPNGYFEAQCLPNEPAHRFIQTLEENQDSIMTAHIAGGHFDITTDISESLLPQQTPLEAWGAISYTKGCYVGQEIIARNKYLGSVKRTMAVAQSEQPLGASLGDEILCNDKIVGKIVALYEGQQAAYLGMMPLEQIGQVSQVNEQNITFVAIPALD